MTVSLGGGCEVGDSRSPCPGLSPREIPPSLQALTHRAGHNTLTISIPAEEEASVAPCSFPNPFLIPGLGAPSPQQRQVQPDKETYPLLSEN